ncbi:hypothetical protein RHSIM_Rhsim04G0222300 [Rhododendron simsii]|uniref:type I protein arginine methyltransferase n=1 Tax=Rhododendron simsii TaxID=118357 RepID=A0A834LSS9_RHOSS|nr:hypothetical protein RHSIM_Rhsim04G0222300 [Rhododendron simsii]
MEVSVAQKQKQIDFELASVSELSSSSSTLPPSPVVARFGFDSGASVLRFHRDSESNEAFHIDLRSAQLFRLSPVETICICGTSETNTEKSYSRGITIQFRKEEESRAFHFAFDQWKKELVLQGALLLSTYSSVQKSNESCLPNGILSASKSKFDDKIEASSAKMYFHYYGQLLHQQNMLQDYVRTGLSPRFNLFFASDLVVGTYYAAVIENRADFAGRVVVDVGAGSGILSLFAAQAGAKHVYAVEASEMAEYARKLIAGNPSLGQRITVVKGKVEEVELPEKADILISEPMGSPPPFSLPPPLLVGTLLVNERMLETYVIARDRFLVPDGKMFPTIGRIHMAPFSDEYLFVEMANKALFWQQQNYYGVDLTPLYGSAFKGYFSQPVVDAFDPRVLVAPAISHVINFTSIKIIVTGNNDITACGLLDNKASQQAMKTLEDVIEEDLYEIDVPLKFKAAVGGRVHGLACWFDVLFNGSTVPRWLTTAPGAPTTHWYQLRCVLPQPLYVMQGQEITGRLHMIAHHAQSYTLYLTLSAKMWGPGAEQGGILQTSSCKFDLKEPYYRMSQPQAYPVAQDQPTHHLVNTQDIQTQSLDEEVSEFLQQPPQKSDAGLD